jgi:UDP-N-acetyl-D-glucosamine dehydrogenase
VLLTDHADFDYELIKTHARYVLDTRRRIDAPHVEIL